MDLDNLTDTTVIRVTDTSLSTNIDNETVILEKESGKYYGLNTVATYIWEMLDDSRTFAELRDALLEEYDVNRERCENDLKEVLSEMEEFGLIEVGGDP